MTDSAARIEELRLLVKDGPGQNEAALQSARAILAAIRQAHPDSTGYVAEKLATVDGTLALWFSARCWEQGGRTMQSTRANLDADLGVLQFALNRYRVDGAPPPADYRPVPPEDEEIIRQVQADHPEYSRELILKMIDAV